MSSRRTSMSSANSRNNHRRDAYLDLTGETPPARLARSSTGSQRSSAAPSRVSSRSSRYSVREVDTDDSDVPRHSRLGSILEYESDGSDSDSPARPFTGSEEEVCRSGWDVYRRGSTVSRRGSRYDAPAPAPASPSGSDSGSESDYTARPTTRVSRAPSVASRQSRFRASSISPSESASQVTSRSRPSSYAPSNSGSHSRGRPFTRPSHLPRVREDDEDGEATQLNDRLSRMSLGPSQRSRHSQQPGPSHVSSRHSRRSSRSHATPVIRDVEPSDSEPEAAPVRYNRDSRDQRYLDPSPPPSLCADTAPPTYSSRRRPSSSSGPSGPSSSSTSRRIHETRDGHRLRRSDRGELQWERSKNHRKSGSGNVSGLLKFFTT